MKVTINQKAMERLLKGQLWIFRSDLVQVETEAAGLATVCSDKGKVVGEALYSPKSLIALRMLTSGQEQWNLTTLRSRLESALMLRERIYGGDPVYRMVFGETDLLPSLVIDRFDEVIAFQTLSAGMELYKEEIVAFLLNRLKPRSLIERNDASVRQKEDLPLLRQALHGEALEEVRIKIGDKSFCFDPLEGQKTGFFLDQRFNAQIAAKFLFGEVLDCFSYVGQFAIQAASHVTSIECVDSSKEAIQKLQRNAELNQCQNIFTVNENAFDYLKACDQEKRQFDGICLDPPAFVKTRKALAQAIKGYKEINLRAMRMLRPGGILVTSSCSQNLSEEEFENVLKDAAKDAKRKVQVLQKLGQPADHPWLLTMPETHYLKCMILRVV